MPREQDKIDVVMLTKNSEKPFLNMCLESIYVNIPVRRLIVIDGYSTDNSIQILKSYPNVSIIQMEGGRGAARERGIREVETDWFAFVDSDVLLCKDWFAKTKRHLTGATGAVWGVAIPIAPSDLRRCMAISMFYRRSLEDTLLIEGRRRGMLHDTLIRTDLVKDIKIPSHLHVWEDHYIKQHITNRGFKWIITKSPYCHHYANLSARNVRELMDYGRIARAYKYYSWRWILMYILLGLPKSVWIYALTGDLRTAKWQLDAYLNIIAGWIADGVKPQTTTLK